MLAQIERIGVSGLEAHNKVVFAVHDSKCEVSPGAIGSHLKMHFL